MSNTALATHPSRTNTSPIVASASSGGDAGSKAMPPRNNRNTMKNNPVATATHPNTLTTAAIALAVLYFVNFRSYATHMRLTPQPSPRAAK